MVGSKVCSHKAILQACEAVELACGELYYYFSDLFHYDGASSRLWLKAALEEENHAKLFALFNKLENEHIVESLKLSLPELEATYQHVLFLKKKVKDQPPSLEEALELAIELEKMLEAYLLEDVITFTTPALEKLFLAIVKSAEHIGALQSAYQKTKGIHQGSRERLTGDVELDHLARLLHDSWPRLKNRDKARLKEGVQSILSEAQAETAAS